MLVIIISSMEYFCEISSADLLIWSFFRNKTSPYYFKPIAIYFHIFRLIFFFQYKSEKISVVFVSYKVIP